MKRMFQIALKPPNPRPLYWQITTSNNESDYAAADVNTRSIIISKPSTGVELTSALV